ncbi:MAG TPA: serine/threonine-protein kinase [Polyangia bacterium]
MSAGDNPPEIADPLIAQLVADRYRVIRKLGEGGMGSVYLAEHVVIEKKFALKVLALELSRRSDLVARFLQEARSASRIGHENVIDIMDFGQSPDGLVYIAMEYLDGRDLGEIVRSKGAMEWSEARAIVLQICRALRAAHDRGIVHRDMKPENIFLIQREGQPHFVKILDFGIAKVMGLDPNGPRLTKTGMIFGTPEYMAPEQAEGKDTDHRADIYAVGCIMYHLITGQTPFVAESFMTMLTKHLMEEPVPPSARRPDLVITPEMDALVLKALEKDREKRWQSMAELLDAVGVCPGPETATPKALGGQTVAMGGAHAAAALKILRAKGTGTQTERVSRKVVDSALSSAEMGAQPASASRGKTLVLVIVGVVLGGAVAAWFALSHGKPALPPPAPPAVVAPAPPAAVVPTPPPAPALPVAIPEPAAAPAAPTEEPNAEPMAKHGLRGHKTKTAPATAKHAAPGTIPASEPSAAPVMQPALPATPGELKPFPKL